MRWAPPLLLPALAFVAVLGDAPPAQSTAPGAPVEALVAAQCHLCHRAASLPKAGLTESCEGCHAWIRETSASPTARAQALTLFPLWPRYETNVQSYLQVPDLDAAMARLRPDWARRYLANPHDLRPNLPETMPRLGLSAEELDTLASAFGRASVPARPSPEPARVAEGGALFVGRGCTACHTFGGQHTAAVLPGAPDLAFARERLTADMAVAWILDPKSVAPTATMPTMGLTEAEALAVRDYLWLTEPGGATPADPLPLPPPLDRPVTWAEVQSEVFGKICAHCHMNPALNEGRAGPGNDGGFGWAATGIELETREGVMAVADQIPAALLRRRDEARRDVLRPGERPLHVVRPELPGMPLGLPPIDDEDTALVLAWIAQGMPE